MAVDKTRDSTADLLAELRSLSQSIWAETDESKELAAEQEQRVQHAAKKLKQTAVAASNAEADAQSRVEQAHEIASSASSNARADYDSREAALREEHMARMAQKEGSWQQMQRDATQKAVNELQQELKEDDEKWAIKLRAKEAELGTEFAVSEKASKRVQAQLSEEMALNVALEAWVQKCFKWKLTPNNNPCSHSAKIFKCP